MDRDQKYMDIKRVSHWKHYKNIQNCVKYNLNRSRHCNICEKIAIKEEVEKEVKAIKITIN